MILGTPELIGVPFLLLKKNLKRKVWCKRYLIVKCMYYGKQFNGKPDKYETCKISGYKEGKAGIYHEPLIIPTEIDIEDLAKGLSHGTTFKPALLNGTHNEDWIQQQLFALDFDNDIDKKTGEDNRTTLEDQIEKCKAYNIYPIFGYYSFSSTPESPRWRLVYCTNKVITDREQRDRLQQTLIHIFEKSDKVTFNPTRMFYGGKQLISFDFDNRIDADKIIDTYWNEDFNEKNSVQKHTQSNKPKINISPKDKLTIKHDDNMTLKIEAIKTLNVEVMKQLLMQGVLVGGDKEEYIPSSITPTQNPPVKLKSNKQLYDFINQIDLCNYLGIYDYVNCILPDHDDKDPSAHIFKTDDGTQIYKCFGCDRAYTITSITEKLAHCKRSEAIEFIKSVYNIKLIESDWAKSWKQKMIDSANYLDSDDFKITYPELASLIRNRKHHIKEILLHFTQYVNEDMQIDDKPFFFASYKTLMEVCGIKGDKSDKLSQSLALFALVDMIIKLSTKDIPEKELNKAKHIAALHHHKKLTGFYSFNEYGTILFESSEEIAKNLKANNMTLKGLSREYILRTFGTELADKVYPQYKYENAQGTSQESDERTSQIVECLFYCIGQKGYSTEKDVVYLLGDKYKYQTTEIQIKKSIQEILVSYDLKRIRANKDIKEQYKINGNGYPFIIVKNI